MVIDGVGGHMVLVTSTKAPVSVLALVFDGVGGRGHSTSARAPASIYSIEGIMHVIPWPAEMR